MASTGAKFPGEATTTLEEPWSDDTWVEPANVKVDDTSYAKVVATTFDSGDQTYVLKAFKFDMSAIPVGATITGVKVVLLAKADTVNVGIDLVQLLNTSRAKVGTNKSNESQRLTASDKVYEWGGEADTWGNALTRAWVQDEDFGVAIGGHAYAANSEIYIEYVTLEVFYSLPPTETTVRKVSLGEGKTPENRESHKVTFKGKKSTAAGTVTVTAALYEGANKRAEATKTLTNSLQEFEIALTKGEAEALESYSDLELRFTGNSSTGETSLVEIAEARFIIPPAAPGGAKLVPTKAEIQTSASTVSATVATKLAPTKAEIQTGAAATGKVPNPLSLTAAGIQTSSFAGLSAILTVTKAEIQTSTTALVKVPEKLTPTKAEIQTAAAASLAAILFVTKAEIQTSASATVKRPESLTLTAAAISTSTAAIATLRTLLVPTKADIVTSSAAEIEVGLAKVPVELLPSASSIVTTAAATVETKAGNLVEFVKAVTGSASLNSKWTVPAEAQKGDTLILVLRMGNEQPYPEMTKGAATKIEQIKYGAGVPVTYWEVPHWDGTTTEYEATWGGEFTSGKKLIAVFRNCANIPINTKTPLETHGLSGTVAVAGYTPTVDYTQRVAIICNFNAKTVTPPEGWTERVDASEIELATKNVTNEAQEESPATFTFSGEAGSVTISFALAPTPQFASYRSMGPIAQGSEAEETVANECWLQVPADAQKGDALFASLKLNLKKLVTPTTPTGWKQLGTTIHLPPGLEWENYAWFVLTNWDGETTEYKFTWDKVCDFDNVIFAFKDASITKAVNAVGASGLIPTEEHNAIFEELTTTQSNCVRVGLMVLSDLAEVTPPAEWTVDHKPTVDGWEIVHKNLKEPNTYLTEEGGKEGEGLEYGSVLSVAINPLSVTEEEEVTAEPVELLPANAAILTTANTVSVTLKTTLSPTVSAIVTTAAAEIEAAEIIEGVALFPTSAAILFSTTLSNVRVKTHVEPAVSEITFTTSLITKVKTPVEPAASEIVFEASAFVRPPSTEGDTGNIWDRRGIGTPAPKGLALDGTLTGVELTAHKVTDFTLNESSRDMALDETVTTIDGGGQRDMTVVVAPPSGVKLNEATRGVRVSAPKGVAIAETPTGTKLEAHRVTGVALDETLTAADYEVTLRGVTISRSKTGVKK